MEKLLIFELHRKEILLYRVENGVTAEAALPSLLTEAQLLHLLESKAAKGGLCPAGNSLVQKWEEFP